MENSLLPATGQRWKLIVTLALLIVGSVAPIWPATGIGWWSGTFLALAGYAFGCLLIRCPACGDRWFWTAAQRPEVYAAVFKTDSCPACQRQFPSGR